MSKFVVLVLLDNLLQTKQCAMLICHLSRYYENSKQSLGCALHFHSNLEIMFPLILEHPATIKSFAGCYFLARDIADPAEAVFKHSLRSVVLR